MRHLFLIILLAPHEAPATAACEKTIKNAHKTDSHLLCPIQNMLRLSSFSFTATTADRRPKLTMSAYVDAPAGG
jgi:hypothetical protein